MVGKVRKVCKDGKDLMVLQTKLDRAWRTGDIGFIKKQGFLLTIQKKRGELNNSNKASKKMKIFILNLLQKCVKNFINKFNSRRLKISFINSQNILLQISM